MSNMYILYVPRALLWQGGSGGVGGIVALSKPKFGRFDWGGAFENFTWRARMPVVVLLSCRCHAPVGKMLCFYVGACLLTGKESQDYIVVARDQY